MYRRFFVFQALVIGLGPWAATAARAEVPPADVRARLPVQFAADATRRAVSAAKTRADAQAKVLQSDDFPAAPAGRLVRAEKAFRDAEYPILRPLLEPVLMPESQFARLEPELKARALLGVGLYFEAQQVTGAAQREALLDAASLQFLELLRKDPFYALNPLIYPASIVELFGSVKTEHAAELEALRAARSNESGEAGSQGLQTVYIAREVDRFSYAVNFLPFGLGQFQNGEAVQGSLFAGSQALALGLNMGSYWMVEGLRSPVDGKYEGGRGNSAETARTWQTLQYVGLGAFAALYLWSVLDAIVDYEPYQVRIRTLDAPPPELNHGGGGESTTRLEIGWNGIGIAW